MRRPVFTGSFALAGELVIAFWLRVNKNGPVPAHAPDLGPCWLWTGSRAKRADGSLSYGRAPSGKRGRTILAHRFAYLAEHPDEDPPAVCHRCDNPLCVRPSHLQAGTQVENMHDMWSKGRGVPRSFPSGTEHPAAKLDPERVRALRVRYAAGGISLKKLGAEFDLDASTAHDIVRGRTWKDAGGPLAGVQKRRTTKSAQTSCAGNSVCPPVARRLVEANTGVAA